MRKLKIIQTDQDIIDRFLDVLGGALAVLTDSKYAGPGFFIFAHSFMQEFVDESFFKKEEVLVQALIDNGFPVDEGPVGWMRSEQAKCKESAEHMLKAAKQWQNGDNDARIEVRWAASEYVSTLRQHMDRIKAHIYPLLEQNISIEYEHKISEELNKVVFELNLKDENGADKNVELLKSLEDELSDWG